MKYQVHVILTQFGGDSPPKVIAETGPHPDDYDSHQAAQRDFMELKKTCDILFNQSKN